MNLKLPYIYPITDTSLSGVSHREQIEKLIAGGATLIQLRDKTASPRDFYAAAEAVLKIARPRAVRIIINDRVDIAFALKADGVHLGQDDLPPENARSILGLDAIIGFSTHSVEQARGGAQLPVDYIAIGPIFSTNTKTNPDVVVGLAGLRAVRKAVGDFPLIAIGGINGAKVLSVLDAGADSAAIISALVHDPEKIEQRMRQFNQLTSA